MLTLTYVTLGLLSGFLSGLLGIGGGILIVPALVFLFERAGILEPVHMAIGTSMAAMAMLIFASARVHYRQGTMRVDIWRRWVSGLAVGALLGPMFVSLLSGLVLEKVFGYFLMTLVMLMLVGPYLPAIKLKNNTLYLLPLGLLIGIAAGILGVGGGVLMIPLLLAMGCKLPEAVGTSAASSLPLVLVSTVSYACLGYIDWVAFLAIGFGGFLSASLGAICAKKMNTRYLKAMFLIFLLGTALRMVW